MELETYHVQVLHFMNPYLIWVQVPETGSIEQIGVYGVLPLVMTMNPIEDTLKTKRGTDWMPAATVLIKELLADAVEVSFCPVYIDDRTTVFDDNIHKYGEVIIKRPNGKYRPLSKLLVKSGYAIYDKNLFQAELSRLKTRVSHKKAKEIIQKLEKKCKLQVEKQTKVFHTAQDIESKLTIENLEVHNQRAVENMECEENVLQGKLEDLEMCEDVYHQSVGRANKKTDKNCESSSLLIKKLKLLKCQTDTAAPAASYFIKQRIDDLRALQKPKTKATEEIEQEESFDYVDDEILKTCDEFASFHAKPIETAKETVRKESRQMTEVSIKEISSKDDNSGTEVYNKPKKSRKFASPNKPPDYDVHKEFRIAYGPPDLDVKVLACKIVPKEEYIERYDVREETDKGERLLIRREEEKEKEDVFAGEDSDVEIDCKLVPNEGVGEKVNTTNLKRKLRIHKEIFKKQPAFNDHYQTVSNLQVYSSQATSDTSNKDSTTSFEDDRIKQHKKEETDSDDLKSVSEAVEQLKSEYKPLPIKNGEQIIVTQTQEKIHVNPFKNVDTRISKFVEKLVTPVLMVHSKMYKRFQPALKLRDIPFNTHIQIILKNMSIEQPMMIQTVSWSSILRGYSTFIIGPKRSGKTMGYLPAICRLVSDRDAGIDGIGPVSIIVCATSNSVSEIEKFARLFLGNKEKVFAVYSGMDVLDVATSLLNGCELLICTPAILVRLLQADYGVDLRRLTSFVLDDCERLTEVFGNEIKLFLFKIKEMLKMRVQKEVKVQYILSSRVWCDFMESLAKKAPDTMVCIGAFQECVLYSKANTTVSFVTKENKTKNVLEFLKDIDNSRRSVIVCRTDQEVEELEKALTDAKYVVFACNSEMTVQDLYNLRGNWDDYEEPLIGPILLCLDSNLTHLNVTDAHYLVHFSLPSLFSAFCKRFSVLNENYPSLFKATDVGVKIKILLEEDNMEQLPKIMNFIKRCTSEVPAVLNALCEHILAEKDKTKAKKLVPVCDNLLTLGECPDFWNCHERHAVIGEVDEPKHWVPKEGMISFKILHYHSAVLYSAKLLSNTTTSGQTIKYSQNHSMLAMKMSMHFGRESNKRLHGVPQVGDICALSIRQNLFVRCQVVKILSHYQNGKPNDVLVRLTDEEKLEKTRDIYLYYLPEELAKIPTHVVHVRLANLQPKDNDITFSDLARDQLKKITDGDDNLYLKGQVALTFGNCVFVESAEACNYLSVLQKTVVLHDFKKLLLENHAMLNENHLQKVQKLCIEGGLEVFIKKSSQVVDAIQSEQKLPTPQWAHLEKDDLAAVYFTTAEDPSTFFVRLAKFEEPCQILVKDIQKYAAQNPKTLASVSKGDIVLAKSPDDDMFDRARIDEILNDDKVKCFFVDHGDWLEVPRQNLLPINQKLITQLPFQAIECRLVGVKPPGQNWTEFATIWFTNYFEDYYGISKRIYAKYFTKENAKYTDGHKYGVVLIDTNSEQDVIINDLIMEVNLAFSEESEVDYLNQLDFKKAVVKTAKELSDDDDLDGSWERVSHASKTSSQHDDFELPKVKDVFPEKPIRSVPLIGSDESDTSENCWQINMAEEFLHMLKPGQNGKANESSLSNLPAIKNADSKSAEQGTKIKPFKNPTSQKSSESDTDASEKISSSNDIHIVSVPKIKELDSDDYTSPEPSLLITKRAENEDLLIEVNTRNKHFISTSIQTHIKEHKLEPDFLRKPKLLWHQKKKNVFIKIQLIGVEKYDLIIDERQLQFCANANDTEYGFNFELYGVVDKKNAVHSNKGQYIWINLPKVLDRNWLTLTKSCGTQKWIIYDTDAIDISSDEENSNVETSTEFIKAVCKQPDSESEDEEFLDDVKFKYSQ